MVDRNWLQEFGFYLFFKYVRTNSSFVQFVYCDSLLSKNVFCDADFNECVGYKLVYYAQGEPVRVTGDAGVVVRVAHEVHPYDPQISAVQKDLQVQGLRVGQVAGPQLVRGVCQDVARVVQVRPQDQG